MKNNKLISALLVITLFAFVSCENEPIKFDDFGMTDCYFPYQTPARTLILGKYDVGFNNNDNNHQFEIGVTMSGVYENTKDRKVFFKLDTTILSNVSNVKYLPTSYYTIETASPVIIPKGDIKGIIMIKLTDAFFNDPKSIAALNTVNYAIPLVITNVEGLDSILTGVPVVANPVRTIATNWSILPKDYTLFGIKYINKYHGNYLRRGADKLIDAFNVEVGTTIYHNQYVERDEVVKASTFDLNTITVPNTIRRYNSTNGGTITLKLVFATDGTCIVKNATDDSVIGSGQYVENGDSWGGEAHDVIHLAYAYTDLVKNEKHEVKDTMVIRDRGVVFETFVPKLK